MKSTHRNTIWLDDLSQLFCCSILPDKESSPEENFNSVSRLLIVLFLVFYFKSQKHHLQIICIFIASLLGLYYYYDKNNPREYFRQLNNLSSSTNNNNNNSSMSDSPVSYKYPLLQTEKAQQKLEYTPIIYPRSHDRDVWSMPSYTHSAINSDNMRYNLTEEYEPLNYEDEYNPRIDIYRDDIGLQNVDTYCISQNGNKQTPPRVASGTSIDQTMGNVDWNQQYGTRIPPQSTQLPSPPQSTQEISAMNSMNANIVDRRQLDPSGTILNPNNLMKTTDWVPPALSGPREVDTSAALIQQQQSLGPSSLYKEKYSQPSSQPADWSIPVNKDKTPISYISERFFGWNKNNKNKKQTQINKLKTNIPEPQPKYRTRSLNYVPLRADEDMSSKQPELTLANNQPVYNFLPNEVSQDMIWLDQQRLTRDQQLKQRAVGMYETDPNKLPPAHMLIPKTPHSIYGPGMTNVAERTKYMQNLQPNLYSYSDTAEPINANMGISYNPDIPPRVVDQVAMNGGSWPLFHRIDPQLVREGGIPKGRLEELPRRTEWSAKYDTYDAVDGSVNFEDIYDPRFTGYGDEYRSYVDVNLGQVQYYYSDIDAYRDPNFGTRSKVDFIDYVDPMGRVKPEYSRNVGLNDVKSTVNNQYDADSIYFREDLMERLMRKRNQELWQLRAAPLRKDAHSHFSSGM